MAGLKRRYLTDAGWSEWVDLDQLVMPHLPPTQMVCTYDGEFVLAHETQMRDGSIVRRVDHPAGCHALHIEHGAKRVELQRQMRSFIAERRAAADADKLYEDNENFGAF